MTGRETESAWRRAVKGLSSEVVVIPISAISFGQSLRQAPQDLDHARMLAEVDQRLPPIIVHAETMTVIDGCHRVLAARLRGEASVSAQMFHGTEKQAFLVGVHANTTHGKPLSLSERLLAARQILLTSPEMSDRAIANVCGLSARAVATRRSLLERAAAEQMHVMAFHFPFPSVGRVAARSMAGGGWDWTPGW